MQFLKSKMSIFLPKIYTSRSNQGPSSQLAIFPVIFNPLFIPTTLNTSPHQKSTKTTPSSEKLFRNLVESQQKMFRKSGSVQLVYLIVVDELFLFTVFTVHFCFLHSIFDSIS